MSSCADEFGSAAERRGRCGRRDRPVLPTHFPFSAPPRVVPRCCCRVFLCGQLCVFEACVLVSALRRVPPDVAFLLASPVASAVAVHRGQGGSKSGSMQAQAGWQAGFGDWCCSAALRAKPRKCGTDFGTITGCEPGVAAAAAGRPREGAQSNRTDFFCRPGRRSEAGRRAPPAAAAGPEPRVAREKSGARPARGCTGRRSGVGAAQREKLAQASRRAGRRRTAALRRRGGATSGTRRPAGRACGAAGCAGAGGAARKPRGGEARRGRNASICGALRRQGKSADQRRRHRGILRRRRGVFDSGLRLLRILQLSENRLKRSQNKREFLNSREKFLARTRNFSPRKVGRLTRYRRTTTEARSRCSASGHAGARGRGLCRR